MKDEEHDYYYPVRKEFYIGFECECFYKFPGKWMPITIDEQNFSIQSEDGDYDDDYIFAEKNEFRVKLLDKEDIESFKWEFKREFTRDKTYNGLYPTKEEYEFGDTCSDKDSGWLEHYPESHKIRITTTDEGFNQDGPNYSVKFNGTILNKSELKDIMTKIGLIK